jgi:hypothetical protein
MKYGFYSKADESQEIIHSGKFESEEQALMHFTAIKQMTENIFTKMYKVVQL